MILVLLRKKSITRFLIPLLLIMLMMQPTMVDLARLPQNEVNGLRDIAKELRKQDWNFSVDPCSNKPSYNNSIFCNCTYLGGICHVTAIFLKGQDLDGVLPPSIVKLPYLKKLDLTCNYLSGNIPPEWVHTTSLEYLSITVNRLTGALPNFIGNITSLVYLNVENNFFNGTVPHELGNLPNLVNLILNANNFSGELPATLSKLTNLTEFGISSNNFRGKIPSFIKSWKHLEKLAIQSSGHQGPIPSSIFLSNNLTELRISDLQGEGSEFPDLKNVMESMKILVLRNCNISGPIPDYLPQMPNLKILDLSFNRLSGDMSKEFKAFETLRNMYFTHNQITGNIPDWIKDKRDCGPRIDLSYNNFTRSSVPTTCLELLNLFKSSYGSNNTMIAECMSTCSKDQTSVHINCGGGKTTVGKMGYDEDEEPGGSSFYVPVKDNYWAVSITGNWDIDSDQKPHYLAQNATDLSMKNSNLYTTARLSPLSLTYYVRCLINGDYRVNLHFAEIIIRGNRSYSSLGRRIFDVYIQGILVLKDFEIKKEANGVDKECIKKFRKIKVNDKNLEINLRWVGKGTTVSPVKGTYGPLISAIDVESEFNPPPHDESMKKILIMVVLPLFFSFIIVSIVYWKCYSGGRREQLEQDLVGLNFQTTMFTFRQVRAATDNFNPQNKIGEGGFGAVYKGILADGTEVAVKQLSSKSKQGNREFVNEIGLISASQHPNLVRLFGYCVDGSQLLLVYEYMENNSLAYNLFGERDGHTIVLNWPTRHKICVGIARGLAFLHEESAIKIVHRDIKATNVLLDKDLNAKISDFGLAKLDHEENTHQHTSCGHCRIHGTGICIMGSLNL